MEDNQPENTRLYVTPVKIGTGISRHRDLVLLTIVYKLSPDEPEEYELRLALEKPHSEAILAGLREAIQSLWGS